MASQRALSIPKSLAKLLQNGKNPWKHRPANTLFTPLSSVLCVSAPCPVAGTCVPGWCCPMVYSACLTALAQGSDFPRVRRILQGFKFARISLPSTFTKNWSSEGKNTRGWNILDFLHDIERPQALQIGWPVKRINLTISRRELFTYYFFEMPHRV